MDGRQDRSFAGRAGVYEPPAEQGMRSLVSVDAEGVVVERYAATLDLFDDDQRARMEARLAAWNRNRRALRLLG